MDKKEVVNIVSDKDYIQKGSIGVSLQVHIVEWNCVDSSWDTVDVSSATVTKEITLQKPDGTVVVKPAVFVTDGTDGLIQYITVLGDSDDVGSWKIQGHVVITSGDYPSRVGYFEVIGNLPLT